MMKQITLVSILLILALFADAQFYGGGVYIQRGYRRPLPPQRYYSQTKQRLPKFKPTLNFSLGYGFPNLDKNYLADFYNVYKGTASQTGPVNAALDYQFSRFNSIGVMASYGKVSVPYFDYTSNNSLPAFTGKLENWSIMFDMMTYFPSYSTVSPYMRTAIGVNNWKQDYLYDDGTKAAFANDPPTLAYQVSIGTRFNLSQNAGFFIEAGYGKYIVNGGLSFKF